MTKRWLTTNRDRLSKKYKLLHQRLKAETASEPSKSDRKRAASQSFRSRGE